MFKEDIPANKLNDYIIASCFLPIFKFEKLIDDNYYLDGGFHDYIPANSLLEKGYDKVYVIDLEAIGIRRPYKYKEKIIRNCTIEVFLSFYNNVYNLPAHKQVLFKYLPKQLIGTPKYIIRCHDGLTSDWFDSRLLIFRQKDIHL